MYEVWFQNGVDLYSTVDLYVKKIKQSHTHYYKKYTDVTVNLRLRNTLVRNDHNYKMYNRKEKYLCNERKTDSDYLCVI